MIKPLLLTVIFCTFFLNGHALSEVTLASNDSSVIIYKGTITFEENTKAFALYENSSNKPSTLEITSLGGGINAGLQLGEWIVENKLNVSIPKYCLSSCANYIFAAGNLKYMGKHAYLIWHGGARQPGLTELLKANANRAVAQTVSVANRFTARAKKHKEIDDHIAFIQQREILFFNNLGINPNITILGQIFPYRSEYPSTGFSGWDYSMRDLAKLGVKNVLIEDNHWMPNAANQGIHIHRLILK